MPETQGFLQLPSSYLALKLLPLLPQPLSLGRLGLPLQFLALTFFRLLHAEPIHEWVRSAKSNRISTHLYRQ